MQELYVVRHGIAEPRGTHDLPDDERPLTPKGEKRIRQVGRGLKTLKVHPDRIVSSSLPRALKTAEILHEVLDNSEEIEIAEVLQPNRLASEIRDWLSTRTEERLMIVGHDPTFSQLVGLLVGEPGYRAICELDKGGVAAFEGSESGRYVLAWLAPPRLLRHLA